MNQAEYSKSGHDTVPRLSAILLYFLFASFIQTAISKYASM